MNKSIRCLIVDDERLARDSLRELLTAMPGVDVVGEVSRVEQGVAAVHELQPDVLLLDIQMPGGGGFELLRRLEKPPSVIFVTAYDQYAVRAFEVNAVDYLLKPVEPERLAEAFGKMAGPDAPRNGQPPSSCTAFGEHDMILLELGRSGHFRAVADVWSIQSSGKYTLVHCADGQSYTVRRSMKAWVRSLPEELFEQLDRGLLVNRAAIRGADFEGRTATLKLGPGGHSIELGRRAAGRLKRLLDEG